ncbi:MAG TPA: STAS domain-containing protein [Nocardioidaceae bacterium]|nr:STAS domain-containing protein [Nocardioidaceae bacterium]
MSSLPEFAPTGHVVVRAPSQLVEVTAEEFLRTVEEALPWCPWVIVDMSGVSRLDGSGLAALNTAATTSRRWHGGIVLVGVDDGLLRPPERSLLVRVFPLYDELADVPALPPRREVPRQRKPVERPLPTQPGEA